MKLNDILIKPVLTEKAVKKAKEKVHTFEVNRKATKFQIKEAVGKLFNVIVGEVRILIRKGKIRKVGKRMKEKKMRDKKIAYISLKKGEIDIFPKT